MAISVTDFKHNCLDIIHRVEETGQSVTIRRHGKVVAKLSPAAAVDKKKLKPWEVLQALGGECYFEAGESVWPDEDIGATR